MISGTLPTELGLLSNLNVLWLDNNPMSGTIPTHFGRLSNLADMYAHN
jgi:hypothetical protein